MFDKMFPWWCSLWWDNRGNATVTWGTCCNNKWKSDQRCLRSGAIQGMQSSWSICCPSGCNRNFAPWSAQCTQVLKALLGGWTPVLTFIVICIHLKIKTTTKYLHSFRMDRQIEPSTSCQIHRSRNFPLRIAVQSLMTWKWKSYCRMGHTLNVMLCNVLQMMPLPSGVLLRTHSPSSQVEWG
jgi:hypothetical protein